MRPEARSGHAGPHSLAVLKSLSVTGSQPAGVLSKSN